MPLLDYDPTRNSGVDGNPNALPRHAAPTRVPFSGTDSGAFLALISEKTRKCYTT